MMIRHLLGLPGTHLVRWNPIAATLVLLALAAPMAASDFEPGYIQVQVTPPASIGEINALYGTTTADSLPPLYLLHVPPGSDEDALIARMRTDSSRLACVEHSFRDETPEGVRQMVVTAVGGTIGDYLDQGLVERIHLPDIQAYATGEGVLVAVLDTGVLATHEALAGAIAPGGYDFIDGDDDPAEEANALDDDGDGLIDEGAGHGTLVAGIVHLVAPGARILPIRVLDDEGRGTTFTLAKGIRYAAEHGADVINMSLGLTERSGIIAHELAQARLLSATMVAAAGNLGGDSQLYYPASDVKVLMVAALDSNDVKADFSSYHARVAVSAPGAGILGPYVDGGYAIGWGTSFAVPFITGQCALIRELVPGIDWDEVTLLAKRGVADIYSIPDNLPYVGQLGTGRVDGVRTLVEASGYAAVPDVWRPSALSIAPTVLIKGGTAEITWDAPRDASDLPGGTLRTFDAAGRLVCATALDPRSSSLRWSGRDAAGRPLPDGAYLLQMTGAGPVRSARVFIVR